jgi:hypothetical protein
MTLLCSERDVDARDILVADDNVHRRGIHAWRSWYVLKPDNTLPGSALT